MLGFYWGAYVHHDTSQYVSVMKRLMKKVSQKIIDPQYIELYGFSGAMEGLRLLEDRKANGKIVIDVTKNG